MKREFLNRNGFAEKYLSFIAFGMSVLSNEKTQHCNALSMTHFKLNFVKQSYSYEGQLVS